MNDKPPERPIECSECKKPFYVLYTEIVGEQITHTSMCSDCPEYHKRLYGAGSTFQLQSSELSLACGECSTTLEALKMGHPLGCTNCYEVFAEELFHELAQAKRVPPRLSVYRKTQPLHIGRKPGEAKEMNLSAKLLALNEALNETLKAENYEQAALLRDQIKELTEKNPELGNKSNAG